MHFRIYLFYIFIWKQEVLGFIYFKESSDLKDHVAFGNRKTRTTVERDRVVRDI